MAKELSHKAGYKLVDLNRLVKTERLFTRFDKKRRSYVIDEEGLRVRLESISKSSKETVIASHLVGGFLPKTLVRCALVLRLDPIALYRRLRARGWTRRKAWENTEAEVLDVSLQESLNLFGRRRVYEIDTTKKSVYQIYKEAKMALSKPGTSRVGQVNWLAQYDPLELERKL